MYSHAKEKSIVGHFYHWMGCRVQFKGHIMWAWLVGGVYCHCCVHFKIFSLSFPSGGNAPSYVYRLISELYHADDQDL